MPNFSVELNQKTTFQPPSLQALEQNLRAAQSLPARVDALNELAWELSRHDLSRAFSLAEEALELSQAVEYTAGTAQALGNLAQLHHYNGNNEIALSYVLQAALHFDPVGQVSIPLFRMLHTQATIYRMLSSYAEALTIFLRLLSLAQKHQETYFQAMALNGIGICYAETGRAGESITYYQRCIQIFEEQQNLLMVAAMSGNMASQYRKLRQFDEAALAVETGLQIAQQLHDAEVEVYLLITRGEIYTDLNRTDEALETFKMVLKRLGAVNIHIQRYRLNALIYMGKIYMKQGLWMESRNTYYEALTLAESTSERAQMVNCHAELAELYKRQGDYKNALQHCELFHKIRESVYTQENTQKMNTLRVLHETDTAQKEAEFYRVQKEMVEKLREQDKRHFETMTQMKDDLIHTASHDLKNPLTNIKTYVYLLRQHLTEDSPKITRYLDRIEDQAEQMRLLISDVLELATLEAHHISPHESVFLNAFLQKIHSDFEIQAVQKQIQLTCTPCSADPVLRFDEDLMKRVFQNLLSNALKFTPKGGRVELFAESNDTTVSVFVRDTGIGIPAEDLPHIFEKFYRVKDQPHLAIEGTGLGLPIAKEIVEQHGGEIRVSSVVGAGSTFQVILPR